MTKDVPPDKTLKVRQELFCIGDEIENTYIAGLTSAECQELGRLLKKLLHL